MTRQGAMKDVVDYAGYMWGGENATFVPRRRHAPCARAEDDTSVEMREF